MGIIDLIKTAFFGFSPPKPHRKRRRSYYSLRGSKETFRKLRRLRTVDDGPIPRGIKIIPRKGFRVLRREYGTHSAPGFPLPTHINGQEVVDWVQVYFADDAVGDRSRPIVRSKRRR